MPACGFLNKEAFLAKVKRKQLLHFQAGSKKLSVLTRKAENLKKAQISLEGADQLYKEIRVPIA
jgi:hypothetical protein